MVKSAYTQVLFRRHHAEVAALLDTCATYSDERLNQRPANGGWSAIQVIHHLILSEELSLAYVRKKISLAPELENAGMVHRWRTGLLWAVLNLPFRFSAPAAVTGERLPEHASLADSRERWEAIQKDWDAFLKSIPAELEDKAVYRHPVVGRLSWTGTMRFFIHHFRRHRKQIMRALEA